MYIEPLNSSTGQQARVSVLPSFKRIWFGSGAVRSVREWVSDILWRKSTKYWPRFSRASRGNPYTAISLFFFCFCFFCGNLERRQISAGYPADNIWVLPPVVLLPFFDQLITKEIISFVKESSPAFSEFYVSFFCRCLRLVFWDAVRMICCSIKMYHRKSYLKVQK